MTNEYRYLLIKSINQITQTFPQTIPLVLSPLMRSFLKFEGKSTFTSLETVLFIREVIEVNPEHRATIFTNICQSFGEIRSHLVIRVALWIIGEYAQSQDEVAQAFKSVKRNLGSLPIYQKPIEDEAAAEEDKEEEKAESAPRVITKTVVLADGSYGTQTIVVDDEASRQAAAAQIQDECAYLPLRSQLVKSEDDYLASCLSVTLTKLTMKAKRNLSLSYKQMSVDSILIICALLKEHQSKKGKVTTMSADRDNIQRMQVCLRILTQSKGQGNLTEMQNVLIQFGRAIFGEFLKSHSKLLPSNRSRLNQQLEAENMAVTQPDERIQFRQLKGKTEAAGDFDITEELGQGGVETSDFMSQLQNENEQKIYQLTGYSDPIYAEAIAEVHHYDILLKIVLINRTQKTIQNINVELLTQGNLKVVEKPVSLTLRSGASQIVKSSLKVSSTDNGAIYGYLTFDSSSGNIPNVININEI